MRRSLSRKIKLKRKMMNLPVTSGICILLLCLGNIRSSEAGRDIQTHTNEALIDQEMTEGAGYGMEKLSTVLVTGSVECDACLARNIAKHPHPISAAVVGVACSSTRDRRKVIRARGVSDQYGDFIIDLPSDLHANPYLDRTCIVTILKVPKKSLCKPTFVEKHKAISLSSVGNGIREYTSGTIRLHNLKHTTSKDCAKRATEGIQAM